MVKFVKSDLTKEENNQTGQVRFVKSATPPTVYNDRPSTPTEGGLTAYAKEKYALPTAGERVGSGVKSILNTAVATPALLFETGVETVKGLDDYLKDKWSKDTWKRVGEDFRYILGDRDTPRTEVKNVEISDYGKINPNSFGMKRMDKAMEQRAEATKGLSGTGAFLADTAIGLGQYASTLPLAIANPAAGLGAMASVSAAQKAYDVAKAGGSATEAYARGAAAGTIEALTEALPLDNLIDLYKKGGKPALKNIIKQLGTEPTEETVSYVANYLADKNAGDDVEFSAKEMGLSALGGLVSAGVMSAGTSAAGRLLNSNKKTTLPTKDAAPKTMPTTAQESVSTQESVVTPPEAKAPQNEVIQPTQTYAPEEASVGAAPAGFEGNAVRGFSDNLATDTARHEEIQHEYQVNPQKYWRLGNKETLGKATAIMDTGIDNAVSTLEQALGAAQAGKKFAPEMVPLSKMVADELAAQGRVTEAERLLSAVAVELTEAGQLGQSAKILRDSSPASRIQTVTKLVNKLNEGLKNKIAVSESYLNEYANAKTDADQAAALDKIYQEIADNLPSTFVDQFNALRYLNMLGNLKTQVRNVSGNTTMTIIRTVKDKIKVGLEQIAKKASGGKYQPTAALVTDKATRKLAEQDWQAHRDETLGEAKYTTRNGIPSAIYDKVTVFKNNGTWGKTENSTLPMKAVRKGADLAKSGLEKARKATAWAMEKGDEVFSKSNYANALASYLKANGITSETFSRMLQDEASGKGTSDILDKARTHAIKEAQKATFRDQNQISDLFAEIGFKNADTSAKKVANNIIHGVLPFRRTPANVMVRMVEYSPIGFAETTAKAILDKKKTGTVDWSEIIDDLAANLTGSGLFVLGMALQNAGKVTGGEAESEEQEKLNDLVGEENYTVEIGGQNYTVDFLSPASVAVMMGAEYEKIREETDSDMAAALRAAGTITNPLLETSMLSGIRDAFDNVAYSENGMISFATNSLVNYLSQGLTSTLGGQIERTTQDERTSTFVDRNKDTGKEMQYAFGSASAKIPGYDYSQIPYIDAWGRTEKSKELPVRIAENFALPFYVSETNVTKADKEIQRLLDANQTGVVPNKPSQSVQVTYKDNPNAKDNQKKYLTAEEYVTYSKIKGQTSYDVVSGMIDTPEYKRLTDEEKADAIKKAYEYAGHLASEAVTGNKHESEKYVELAKTAKKELGLSESEYLLLCNEYGATLANGDKIRDAYKEGITPWEYASYSAGKSKYNEDGQGSLKIAEQQQAIEGSGFSEEKQIALWKLAYPDWVEKAEEKGIPFDVYVKIKLGKY